MNEITENVFDITLGKIDILKFVEAGDNNPTKWQGIDIEFIPTQQKNDEEITNPRIRLELVDGKMNLYVWEQGNREDYTQKICLGDYQYLVEKEKSLSSQTTAEKENYKYQPKTKEELKELVKDESIYLGDIDTSLITDMSELFSWVQRKDYSGIETWNTSNVKDMSFMFAGAKEFNQDISNWDVSNVTDMTNMFAHAYNFNQDIGKWNTSNVEYMGGVFCAAVNFDQPIGSWDTRNVKNMAFMFNNASVFNQPIGGWDVSNVMDLWSMFTDAEKFNQDLSKWKINPTARRKAMFERCPIERKYKPVRHKENAASRYEAKRKSNP